MIQSIQSSTTGTIAPNSGEFVSKFDKILEAFQGSEAWFKFESPLFEKISKAIADSGNTAPVAIEAPVIRFPDVIEVITPPVPIDISPVTAGSIQSLPDLDVTIDSSLILEAAPDLMEGGL